MKIIHEETRLVKMSDEELNYHGDYYTLNPKVGKHRDVGLQEIHRTFGDYIWWIANTIQNEYMGGRWWE